MDKTLALTDAPDDHFPNPAFFCSFWIKKGNP